MHHRTPWTGGNPLRREADRVRGRLRATFMVACLLAAVCGVVVGRTAWTDADHDADETARHRHSVTAVTVGETTFRAGSGSSTRPLTVAPATWRDPLQRLHTDTVPVPAATRSGDTVQLLVDDNGKAATAPPRTAEIALTAIAFGTGASAGIVLAAGAVIHTCLRLVDTRCARAWESEWESVEPQWSGRLRPGHGTGDD